MLQFPSRLVWLLVSFSVPLCATGAELTGILRDNQGIGLSGISVTASIYLPEGSTQLVATTDAAGHFGISGDPGSWRIDVPAAELNARGYFSVPGPSLTVTGQSAVRLTTRKIDFTHRINGHLIDEAGQPLAGYSLRARIWENGALFETNAVTGTNGSFLIGATPAIWSLCCLEPPPGSMAENLVAERLVEVEITNAEKQVTFVAPAATSTISVTVSNLGGRDVVASAEAFGATFRLIQSVPCCLDAEINFRVFDGVWTISVANGRLLRAGTPPEPFSVAVTNGIVSVVLASVAQPPAAQQVQRVRTVTASGMIVSNTSVSVIDLLSSLPQPFGTPGVFDLRLPDGHWWLTATMATYPDWIGWRVSREVVIASNVPPPEVTLVFPEPEAGPQIVGTIRTSGGSGLSLRWVSLSMTEGGTNYDTSVVTDALGHFGIHVLPGRWQLQTDNGWCSLSSLVVVSNQDAEVNFEVLVPVSVAPVPVHFSAVDDGGPPLPEFWLDLGGPEYLMTNASPGIELLLRPGIFHASLGSRANIGDPYTLFPSFTWQLSPGMGTNLILAPRQTPARIEGRLRDEEGRLLLSGYGAAWTSVNGTNFWAYGSIASGYFSLNVFPGEWQVGASVAGYPSVGVAENAKFPSGRSPNPSPPRSYYTTPTPRWIRVSNDLARCDFVATNVPIQPAVTLDVAVIREDGSNLGGIAVTAVSLAGVQTGSTDEMGVASLAVPPGRLTISARLAYDNFTYKPLLWPAISLDITAPSNHVVLIVRQATSCITGTISNAPALGLQPQLFSSAEVNGTNYLIEGCPDSTGHYCLPAVSSLWTVWIDDSSLADFGIQSVAPREVTVPPTGQALSVDFVLAPIAGDFREARFMKPVLLPNGALQLEFRGQTALSWRVERSGNLNDWMPVALGATVNGTFVIQEPLAASDPAAFYRAVWVR